MASTTLIQSGSVIIYNQTSASTSVKQHVSESSGSSTPSGHEQKPNISGLERFMQSLASEGISTRTAELIAGVRRIGVSFTNRPGVNRSADVVNQKLILIDTI